MKKVKAHPYLSDINSYKPGKDKIEGSKKKVVKLSSNENALGCSKKAEKAYQEHSKEVFRYADGACVELREAIAKKHQVNAGNIVCGAGSDELLYMLASAYAGKGDEVIYSRHGFLMYAICAKRVGARPVAVDEVDLKADIDGIINAVNDKTKIIFLANPNNPTGSYLDEAEIQKLIDGVPKDVLIVLDHAYDEFASGTKGYPDAIKFVQKNENVVMTRTFSKIYGLASLRIGWCFAGDEVVDVLNKVRGPFNVGGPAQKAARAAVEDGEFLQESLKHNNKWLKRFFDEALGYKKIKLWPSIANFILFDFGSNEGAIKANEEFLENGVVTRQMEAYLLPNCLRITIGNDEENELVLRILKKIDKNV